MSDKKTNIAAQQDFGEAVNTSTLDAFGALVAPRLRRLGGVRLHPHSPLTTPEIDNRT